VILRERPLRILAADDSAVMRSVLLKLFLMHAEDRQSELPRMELCGVARDGVECLELVEQLGPDVLVLDLEMPKLNGLEVLDRLRLEESELPVIMCSAYTEHGARSTLEALGRGASEYVTKPSEQKNFGAAMQFLSQQLLPRIAALAKGAKSVGKASGKAMSRDNSRNPRPDKAEAFSRIEVVVIGLSTGGPSALEQLLPRLPLDFPAPVLIVQHMPKLFTGALAERLDKCCALRVQEAYDDAVIRPGTVWLAPGDAHMEVAPRRVMASDAELDAMGMRVRLHQQEPLNHCKPAVDYLFLSAARMCGAGTLALVMTGMGADGLKGARAVHERGGTVLAQDEATSAVWGMPGRVSEAGIANATLPLWGIASALKQRISVGRAARMGIRSYGSAPKVLMREMNHGLL
jgi:two-component system, chemotaxis family, protein-glutamate methylesterase/glutaminase